VRLSLSSLLNQTLSAVTPRPLHQRRQAEVADYRRMLDRQANGELSLASLIEAAVSFQITVLKVLAGHSGGRLPVDDLKRAVSLLICSGPDWTDRMKRLLERAPDLDIFSQLLVVRDAQGWQITETGRMLCHARLRWATRRRFDPSYSRSFSRTT
jgi:hypothetical protein